MKISPMQKIAIMALQSSPLAWIATGPSANWRIICDPERPAEVYGRHVNTMTILTLIQRDIVQQQDLSLEQQAEYDRRKALSPRLADRTTPTRGFLLTALGKSLKF